MPYDPGQDTITYNTYFFSSSQPADPMNNPFHLRGYNAHDLRLAVAYASDLMAHPEWSMRRRHAHWAKEVLVWERHTNYDDGCDRDVLLWQGSLEPGAVLVMWSAPTVLVRGSELICPRCCTAGQIFEREDSSRTNMLAIEDTAKIGVTVGDAEMVHNGYACAACQGEVGLPQGVELVYNR